MQNRKSTLISEECIQDSYLDFFFPYTLRTSQKHIITKILQSIRQKKQCCVEAPCGTGKTIANITALLSDQSQDYIFWLGHTKSIYENVTKDILAINKFLEKNNLKQHQLLLATFIGKQKMCLNPIVKKSANFYEECRDLREARLCEYYNNVFDEIQEEKLENDETYDEEKSVLSLDAEDLIISLKQTFKKGNLSKTMLTKEKWTWAEYIIERCIEIPLMCPFEIMSLIGRNANIIAWDYNYIFLNGPQSSMFQKLRIFPESKKMLVIDEADKFYDRMSMYLTQTLTNHKLQLIDERLLSLLEKGHIGRIKFNDYSQYIEQLTELLTKFINKMIRVNTNKEIIQYVKKFFQDS